MKAYNHLSFEEREVIARLRADGLSQDKIAQALGRSRSTIWRELRRNANKSGSYHPTSADGRYLARRQRLSLLERVGELAAYVVDRLNENWTPEQIAGWLKSGAEKTLRYISHESIYAWIYSSARRPEKLWKLLPRHRARRGFRPARASRSLIKDRKSISGRPNTVNKRLEGGHWEGDLMICRKMRPVLVMTERKSRFTIIARLKSKRADETAKMIMDIFRQLSPELRRSITFDNGGEFARHTMLREAFKMATWFCDAYASWQKGGVENMNGRLRRDLPRKINLDDMSDEDLQDIALMHNLTPRKCLRFKTPVQAILSQLGINARISFNQNVALQIRICRQECKYYSQNRSNGSGAYAG